MVQKLRSRNSLYISDRPYCPVCSHQISENCNCLNCQAKREKHVQVLKKRIREVYAIDSFAKVDYSTLGLYERCQGRFKNVIKGRNKIV